MLKFRVDIEVQQGQNCMKLKVLGQLDTHLRVRTKLNFDQIPKIKLKWRRFED
jgi:hypothetical protein